MENNTDRQEKILRLIALFLFPIVPGTILFLVFEINK